MLRPEQEALLAGLPGHWRYVPTGNDNSSKRAILEGWNIRGNGQTLEQVLRLNHNPTAQERWRSRKLIGVGVITGEESNGLLVVDFDGTGSQAARAFTDHFKHKPSELPKTVVNISGKKGRAKAYFNVPPNWWEMLANRSATWRDKAGNVILEGIWMNTTGTGRHAVIVGDHPDSSDANPLYYRWAPGCAPSEVPVAEAPEWLLLGIIAKCEETAKEVPTAQDKARSGSDDATQWERLNTADRVRLTQSALEYCPNRTGRGSGTYDKVRRILCGLLNEFELDLAIYIVTESEWDKKNEWDSGTNSVKTLQSLAKSKVPGDRKAQIASLFYFARDNGWVSPAWAIPPVEVKEQVEDLRKLLNLVIRDADDPVAQSIYMGRAWKEFGVDADSLRRLALDHYLGSRTASGALTLAQIQSLTANTHVDSDVIDGVLGRRVHVLAGASHSGKTTLACFLANRVITSSPFDVDNTRHSTMQDGKVLVLTSDCSDSDMVRDLALEGVDQQVAGDRLKVCSGITFNEMVRVIRIIEDFAPDLVIMDCLTSMACHGVRIGDPAYADPIRLLVRHNGMSWRKCAFVILHHTRRDEATSFSGTEQIKAACEELWLYFPPELKGLKKGKPKPVVGQTRHLELEKSRTGYAGRTFAITRNAFQAYWQVHKPTVQATSPQETLSNYFREVSHDKWQIASEWQREMDIEFHPRSLRRYLDQLVGSLLESKKMKSLRTGRVDTHYRPLEQVRQGAQAMITCKSDGINAV